ncbi:hypothetical protein CEXT_31961 [Caerostris extrusa]|uniref:Uncharacterized protein n=1 Tax=Caerostris extrusa TaxID=172846 RepID=A0AAV4RWG9_CAEEX|nr:hypothetical protein CEXT_31961 [Caerostris extrusa]
MISYRHGSTAMDAQYIYPTIKSRGHIPVSSNSEFPYQVFQQTEVSSLLEVKQPLIWHCFASAVLSTFQRIHIATAPQPWMPSTSSNECRDLAKAGSYY